MIYLHHGSKSPTVATLQVLVSGGIKVDGVYGPKTEARVKAYQKVHKPPLTVDGVVGRHTWSALMTEHDVVTIDVVDMVEQVVPDSRGVLHYVKDPVNTFTGGMLADLRRGGSDPITLFGQSNSTATMVQAIIQRALRPRRIALLRIYGHGSAGSQNVSAGEEALDEHMTSLDTSTLWWSLPQLQQLAPYFARWGAVELRGCEVGAGASGHILLRNVAGALQVPVTAGKHTQYSGLTQSFALQGPITTSLPYGGTLRGWAEAASKRE
ncbi:MAG: peptidoglycan-binding protein [Bryobacteraceae bacterium]